MFLFLGGKLFFQTCHDGVKTLLSRFATRNAAPYVISKRDCISNSWTGCVSNDGKQLNNLCAFKPSNTQRNFQNSLEKLAKPLC